MPSQTNKIPAKVTHSEGRRHREAQSDPETCRQFELRIAKREKGAEEEEARRRRDAQKKREADVRRLWENRIRSARKLYDEAKEELDQALGTKEEMDCRIEVSQHYARWQRDQRERYRAIKLVEWKHKHGQIESESEEDLPTGFHRSANGTDVR
ncbi:MAG: hypothetical protein Q9220_001795 [cf. Caloplaca sp. 1 TL-2023]